MPFGEPFTKVYLHAVWSTWDRQPLISPQLERSLYACIKAEAAALRAEVVAIGGTEDHIHVLFRLPATLAPATLLKKVKGASSHLVTHAIPGAEGFKWQGHYGAFSVCPRHVPNVTEYVARQKEHHRTQTIYADWEPTD